VSISISKNANFQYENVHMHIKKCFRKKQNKLYTYNNVYDKKAPKILSFWYIFTYAYANVNMIFLYVYFSLKFLKESFKHLKFWIYFLKKQYVDKKFFSSPFYLSSNLNFDPNLTYIGQIASQRPFEAS